MFTNKVFNKPTSWDMLVVLVAIGSLLVVGWAMNTMSAPFEIGSTSISLSPTALPYYAARSVLRMALALALSLLATFIFGTMMARSKVAEKIGLPLLDVLQSIPILGFLSITIVGFINLFPDKMLGPECAAIFAIFTSQAWNMILSFYASLKTIPRTYIEACQTLGLSKRRRFWAIEVPYALPNLLWNMMMSLSAGWFFVVASEAISIAGNDIMLPGIGSYIATAIIEQDKGALVWALGAMFTVILIYDQCAFRPLLAWSARFTDDREIKKPWFLQMMQASPLINFLRGIKFHMPHLPHFELPTLPSFKWLLWPLLLVALAFTCWQLVSVIPAIALSEVKKTVVLGFYTMLKIFAMLVVVGTVWIPVGVWLGRTPRRARIAGPIVQFAAAFPVNLIYPVAAIGIIQYDLNVNLWCMPLLVLGTQWYLLFNVIAGTSTLEPSMFEAAKMLHLKRGRWWRKFMIPAIGPNLITGFLSCAGGCWNAAIVAEVIVWGNNKLVSPGLGAYIVEKAIAGDTVHLGLGIAVMCCFVMILNHLVWQPLYNYCAPENEC